MPTFLRLIVLLFIIGLCPTGALAEMYKWVDDSGKMHFTDNVFNIPQKHLNQVRTFEEKYTDEDMRGQIPLKKTQSGYMVEVMLNGFTPVSLVVDTGATSTVISPQALDRAGITPSAKKTVTLMTAGGKQQAGWAEVESMTVGDFKRGPMKVVAHDALEGADGLLGMDFLGVYRVEIMTIGPSLRLMPQ